MLTSSHRMLYFLGSDLREENKLLGEQPASVDNLTEKAVLSWQQLDGHDAKEREEEEAGE